jgi:thiopeptide-type bacteriocin biosynthesis protein
LATSPEGNYAHELLLPMHYTAPALSVPEAPPKTELSNPPLLRRFAPGSEWLMVKLYTGAAGVDTVLRSIVRPVVADALAAGIADEWFFVRYSDPGWHLRLRVHGDGDRLLGEVLRALTANCETSLDDGLMWRVQVDTYEREVERYGGERGVLLAERVFFADSEAALGVVEQLHRDEMGDRRWLFALVGADRLMADLGLGLRQRHAVVAAARARFARRFKAEASLCRQMSSRYRVERAALEQAMLDPAGPIAAFTERGEALRPMRTRLAAAIDEELLQSWVASVVHMQINRILRWAINRQEFVIYDFLARHYTSSLSRDE